jgi:hypothetical protein
VHIEGPYFVYDAAPGLFLGRSGLGPLKVVWDTNILLDYLQHGHEIWDDENFDVDDDDYRAELDALAFLVNLWTRRDIQIDVLEQSIVDARRHLSEKREADRAKAVREVANALALERMYADDDDSDAPRAVLSDAHENLLRRIPAGNDRGLVRESMARCSHVFVTRDRGHPQARRRAAANTTAACFSARSFGGALRVWRDVRGDRDDVPAVADLQRMSHLIQPLPRRHQERRSE